MTGQERRYRVWLPYVRGGSGTDVFTATLATALSDLGHETVVTRFPHTWQYAPWALRAVPAPPDIDVTITNMWNGFAFRRRGVKLVAIEHHCVFDPAYLPYRSPLQAIFHETLIRPFEKASIKAADKLVAVSAYTAASLHQALGGPPAEVIPNGIDTAFLCPDPDTEAGAGVAPSDGTTRLLFVGNLIRRKGADLLPGIMERLGPGFELSYTSGLRSQHRFARTQGMRPLGRLSAEDLRREYRKADIVLFPTRLEGFGYAAAEAMACGTPVVASACSSLPEVVEDGVTGRLCSVDDVAAFAAAIRDLAAAPERLRDMGRRARAVAVARFGLRRMATQYAALFAGLLAPSPESR